MEKLYKKYNKFDFKWKCSNAINIISLGCYNNKLFLIKIKQLLIKKKKSYLYFRLVCNTK